MTARLAPLLFASAMALSGGAKTLPQGRAQPLQGSGCEAPGFVKLSGSDTCVRLGGSVRADVSVTSGGRGSSRRP